MNQVQKKSDRFKTMDESAKMAYKQAIPGSPHRTYGLILHPTAKPPREAGRGEAGTGVAGPGEAGAGVAGPGEAGAGEAGHAFPPSSSNDELIKVPVHDATSGP